MEGDVCKRTDKRKQHAEADRIGRYQNRVTQVTGEPGKVFPPAGHADEIARRRHPALHDDRANDGSETEDKERDPPYSVFAEKTSEETSDETAENRRGYIPRSRFRGAGGYRSKRENCRGESGKDGS